MEKSGSYVNSPMKLFHINEYLKRDIVKTDNTQAKFANIFRLRKTNI